MVHSVCMVHKDTSTRMGDNGMYVHHGFCVSASVY